MLAEQTYRTLMSDKWIATETLDQIRRELIAAGFRPWRNPMDVEIAESDPCAQCGEACRHEGYERIPRRYESGRPIPQHWKLAVCTACGAGLSF